MYRSLNVLAVMAISAARFTQAAPLIDTRGGLTARDVQPAYVAVSGTLARTTHAEEHISGEQLFTRGGLNKVADGLGKIDLGGLGSLSAPRISSPNELSELTHSDSGVHTLLPEPQSSSDALILNKDATTKQRLDDLEWPPLQPQRQGQPHKHITSAKTEVQLSQQNRDYKQAQSLGELHGVKDKPIQAQAAMLKLNLHGQQLNRDAAPFIPKQAQSLVEPPEAEVRGKLSQAQATMLNFERHGQRLNKDAVPFIPKSRLDESTTAQVGRFDHVQPPRMKLLEDQHMLSVKNGLGKDAAKIKVDNPQDRRPKQELSVFAQETFDSPDLKKANKLFREGTMSPIDYVAALEKERKMRQELALHHQGFTQQEWNRRLNEQTSRPDKQGMNEEEAKAFETTTAHRLTRKNQNYIEYLARRIKAVIEGRLVPDQQAEALPPTVTRSSTRGSSAD